MSGLPVVDFESVGPPAGDRLPEIVLPNQKGETVDLHEVREGRRALLVVFRSADW
jgi:hypothetical protein